MTTTGYDQLRAAVQKFNVLYPRPSLDLSLEQLSPINTPAMWQNADKKGVYFLFDQGGGLIYIGKASYGSNIGVRIGERFSSKDCRCLDDDYSHVTMLATIALPEDRTFEASSIEEYLIHELQPPVNVIGRRRVASSTG